MHIKAENPTARSSWVHINSVGVHIYLHHQHALEGCLSFSSFHQCRGHCSGMASLCWGRCNGIICNGPKSCTVLDHFLRSSNFETSVFPSRNQAIPRDATQIRVRALSLPMNHTSAETTPLALFSFHGISLYQLNSPPTPVLAICVRTSSLQNGPGPTDPTIILTLRDL